MKQYLPKILTLGVMASIGAAAVTLWLRQMDLAMASFVALALFAYAFEWVPDD